MITDTRRLLTLTYDADRIAGWARGLPCLGANDAENAARIRYLAQRADGRTDSPAPFRMRQARAINGDWTSWMPMAAEDGRLCRFGERAYRFVELDMDGAAIYEWVRP